MAAAVSAFSSLKVILSSSPPVEAMLAEPTKVSILSSLTLNNLGRPAATGLSPEKKNVKSQRTAYWGLGTKNSWYYC